jgi:hypothetical protein
VKTSNVLRWLAVAIVAAGAWRSSQGARRDSFEWKESDSAVALVRAGNVVWQCQYGKSLAMPMFHPLALTDGTVLTWDAPPDHPWHHALWFAWKYLNRANYWDRSKASRPPYGVTEWTNVSTVRRPDFSALIRMDLAYREAGQAPVLTERRQVEISPPAKDGSYHLDWTMVFTAGDKDVALDRAPIAGEPGGQPTGGYAGLSLRFAKDLADWSVVTTKGPVAQDAKTPFHCEAGATGVDYSGRIAGRDAGIAFLDHPANLNSPTPWYTIMNREKEFAFSEAALIYYKPHTLRAGSSLTLRYRVFVHPGRWSPKVLARARAEYVTKLKTR